MNIRQVTAFLAAGIVLVGTLQGASDDSWDNLKELRKGQKIQVVQMDWKSVQGTFLEYSDTGISLAAKTGVATLAREDVLRVTLQEHSKRLRNALIGAAIGAGAGVAIGAATVDSGPQESGEGNLGKTLFGLIGAGAGGGVGAAIASRPTVYRAPKPRAQVGGREPEAKHEE